MIMERTNQVKTNLRATDDDVAIVRLRDCDEKLLLPFREIFCHQIWTVTLKILYRRGNY